MFKHSSNFPYTKASVLVKNKVVCRWVCVCVSMFWYSCGKLFSENVPRVANPVESVVRGSSPKGRQINKSAKYKFSCVKEYVTACVWKWLSP